MSPEECRHEALKRLAESDELFEQWTAAGTASAVDDHTDRGTFDRLCHLRQTAAAYASLANY